MTGDGVLTDLADAGAKLAAARDNLVAATNIAMGVAWVAVEHGQSEQSVAEALGVTRMTVRKWIGK